MARRLCCAGSMSYWAYQGRRKTIMESRPTPTQLRLARLGRGQLGRQPHGKCPVIELYILTISSGKCLLIHDFTVDAVVCLFEQRRIALERLRQMRPRNTLGIGHLAAANARPA